MKKETKHIIRTLGTILFILYVLALIYFLFFSEEYGRAAMEERQYRYNLIPFVKAFLGIQKTAWTYGSSYKSFWKCNWFSSIWIYTAGYSGQNEKRMADRTGRIWA